MWQVGGKLAMLHLSEFWGGQAGYALFTFIHNVDNVHNG